MPMELSFPTLLYFILAGNLQGAAIAVIVCAISTFRADVFLCIWASTFLCTLLHWRMFTWQISHCLPRAGEEAGDSPPFVVQCGEQCQWWLVWREIRIVRDAVEDLVENAHHHSHWVPLLGRLSHELNTNIHAILGAAQVLGDSYIDQDFVRIISHAGGVMANIVSDFLDFCLCEEGQLSPRVQRFTISSIVQHVRLRFEAEAKHMGLILDFAVVEKTMAMNLAADFDRLYQILSNLLCNAFLAVQKVDRLGQVSLSIEVIDTGMVQFCVTDNGCGITAEDQERLFQPFSRALGGGRHNAEPAPGCGLGLCICHHLVSLMGGNIQLTSVVNEGTVVRFYVPVAGDPCSVASAAGEEGLDPNNNNPKASFVPEHGTVLVRLPFVDIHARLSRVPLPSSTTVTAAGSTTGTLSTNTTTSSSSYRFKRGSFYSRHQSSKINTAVGSAGLLSPNSWSAELRHRDSGRSSKCSSISHQSGAAPLATATSALPGYCGSKVYSDGPAPPEINVKSDESDGSLLLGNSASHSGRRHLMAGSDPAIKRNSARSGASAFSNNSAYLASEAGDPKDIVSEVPNITGTSPVMAITLTQGGGPPTSSSLHHLPPLTNPPIAPPMSDLLPPVPPPPPPLPPVSDGANIISVPVPPAPSQQPGTTELTRESSMQDTLSRMISLASLRRIPSTTSTYNTSSPATSARSGRNKHSESAAKLKPKLHCYIVDDNAINLVLLKKLLQKTFLCEVHSCSTAMELLGLVRTRDAAQRNMVLTDIHMPEMDGFQLGRELRTFCGYDELPIVAVTADHTLLLREECFHAGMQAVLAKPMSCETLAETVYTVLRSTWTEEVAEGFMKHPLLAHPGGAQQPGLATVPNAVPAIQLTEPEEC